MKKTYRIKTNNQEQLQRKQNESDATSRWIEFQKTRPRRRIQDKDGIFIEVCCETDSTSVSYWITSLTTNDHQEVEDL